MRAARSDPPPEQLVPFKLIERGVARAGDPVVGGGHVTSGTFSPSLEIGIGLVYLPRERSAVGSEFEVDVRGKARRGVVAERPLYRHP